MRKIKRILSFVLVFAMLVTFFSTDIEAKAKVKLNQTKITLDTGYSTTLKLTGASKVSWKSSDAKVATVTSKGKVSAVDKGTCKIIATDKKTKKKYSCTVTVNRKEFILYNSMTETKEIPTGCRTFSLYGIRQLLSAKGDMISAKATWSSSDESILYVIDNKSLRTIGFGEITLTVQSGSKTYKYDVSIVKEDPYALTYDDFDVINVKMDTPAGAQIQEGASFNFIDKFPEVNTGKPLGYFRIYREGVNDDYCSRVFISDQNNIVETKRGIKIGSSLNDIYEAYGAVYIKKWGSAYTYPNVNGHTATKNVVLHYPVKENNICYMICFAIDQNDNVLDIEYASHSYHQ